MYQVMHILHYFKLSKSLYLINQTVLILNSNVTNHLFLVKEAIDLPIIDPLEDDGLAILEKLEVDVFLITDGEGLGGTLSPSTMS